MKSTFWNLGYCKRKKKGKNLQLENSKADAVRFSNISWISMQHSFQLPILCYGIRRKMNVGYMCVEVNNRDNKFVGKSTKAE